MGDLSKKDEYTCVNINGVTNDSEKEVYTCGVNQALIIDINGEPVKCTEKGCSNDCCTDMIQIHPENYSYQCIYGDKCYHVNAPINESKNRYSESDCNNKCGKKVNNKRICKWRC